MLNRFGFDVRVVKLKDEEKEFVHLLEYQPGGVVSDALMTSLNRFNKRELDVLLKAFTDKDFTAWVSAIEWNQLSYLFKLIFCKPKQIVSDSEGIPMLRLTIRQKFIPSLKEISENYHPFKFNAL